MTPDDEVRLADSLAKRDDSDTVLAQARPNVVLELGMSSALYPERTILITMGSLRSISDISGLYEIRMDGSVGQRQYLYDRLKDSECDVTLQGRWAEAGDFVAVLESLESRDRPLTSTFPIQSGGQETINRENDDARAIEIRAIHT